MNKYPGKCVHCEIRVPKGEGRLHRYEGERRSTLLCPGCHGRESVIRSVSRGQARYSRKNPQSLDNVRLKKLHAEHTAAKGANRGKTWGEKLPKPTSQLGFKFESIPASGRGHWEDPELRSWVSPDGETHPLNNGSTHTDWIRNYPHKIPVEHTVKHRSGNGNDLIGTFDKMLKSGWVRKVGCDHYEVDKDHVDKVRQHVKKNHEWVQHSTVIVRGGLGNPFHIMHHNDGGRLEVDNRAVESRADALIRERLADGVLPALG
jgi:hypothetical protein